MWSLTMGDVLIKSPRQSFKVGSFIFEGTDESSAGSSGRWGQDVSVVQQREEEGLGRGNDFTVGLTWERSVQAGVGITEFFSFNF